MQCIKCGKPVAEGEIFCPLCSLTPKDPKKKRLQQKKSVNTAPQPKVPAPKAKHTLVDSLAPPAPQRAYGPTQEKNRRNYFPAFLVMLILAFGALSYIAMMYHQWVEVASLFDQLERDVEGYRADIVDLQSELASSQSDLAETKALYDNAVETITALQAQLNSTESTVNQNQYDMTTQQSELTEVMAENQDLTTRLTDKESELALLTEQVTSMAELMVTMTEEQTALTEAYDFMNEFVVFVSDDGTNLYHKYGCSEFNDSSFWAYNRSLAETNGNSPCPYCIEN
ncbi:MAG: hypothetical protein R3Y62_07455 [Eubacteriales bacterium]